MRSYLAKPEVRVALLSAFVLAACGGGGGGTETAQSAVAPIAAPAPTSGLTYIDTSIPLPAGYPGVRTALIQSAGNLRPTVPPADGSTGAFRTVCTFSHMGYNDPIVYPGRAGASHLHAFFGNVDANEGTVDPITKFGQIDFTGPSTCRGGTLNRSGYWVPAMIAPNGAPQAPEDLVTYYKSGYQGASNRQITVPPEGLRMIAGNSKSQTEQDVVQYVCGPWAPGFLSADPKDPFIPTCQRGEQLIMRVTFPQCWDGTNLDSPDHKSHMAYGNPLSGCPLSHPVAIPEIVQNVKYFVRTANTEGWRLSSDVSGAPAGSSGHADWWMGWDIPTITTWIRSCDNAGADCGTYLMGDGTMLTGADANPTP